MSVKRSNNTAAKMGLDAMTCFVLSRDITVEDCSVLFFVSDVVSNTLDVDFCCC